MIRVGPVAWGRSGASGPLVTAQNPPPPRQRKDTPISSGINRPPFFFFPSLSVSKAAIAEPKRFLSIP
jgi:hypothetical protein